MAQSRFQETPGGGRRPVSCSVPQCCHIMDTVRNLHNSKKSFKQLVTIVNGAMVQNGSVWSENILQNM